MHPRRQWRCRRGTARTSPRRGWRSTDPRGTWCTPWRRGGCPRSRAGTSGSAAGRAAPGRCQRRTWRTRSAPRAAAPRRSSTWSTARRPRRERRSPRRTAGTRRCRWSRRSRRSRGSSDSQQRRSARPCPSCRATQCRAWSRASARTLRGSGPRRRRRWRTRSRRGRGSGRVGGRPAPTRGRRASRRLWPRSSTRAPTARRWPGRRRRRSWRRP
mmetsp:Transcript_10945/g.27625  ORF Transcript_10945/g.27625 Transcript_10945/m.27625 type:complete len:214 (-) Transcript_10945:996-1637(-)